MKSSAQKNISISTEIARLKYFKSQLSTCSFGLSSEYQIRPNDNNIVGVVKQYVKKFSSK